MKLSLATIISVLVPPAIGAQDDAFASRGVWVDNCGLNACTFVAHWFDCFVDAYGMLGDLEIGAHCEQPASLLSLKKYFEARGLKVSAYKQASFEEMLTGLDGKQVCIFHVNIEDSWAGHFYVIVAATKTHVLLVDAAKEFGWVPINKFKETFAESFSGFYLCISRPAEAAQTTTSLRPERNVSVRR